MNLPPIIDNAWQRLIARPFLIVFVILGLWVVWLGWSTWHYWPDHPLPPAQVSAQQLRVNSGQYQQLQAALQAYHHPAKSSLSTVPAFAAPTTSSSQKTTGG